MSDKNIKAAIYVRTATNDGISAKAQIKLLRDYAERHQLAVVKEYKDIARSGIDSLRPAFAQLLQEAKEEKFEVLLVKDLSRISRSLLNWLIVDEQFSKHGILVVAVDGPQFDQTPDGKLIKTLWVAAAEYESNLLAERTKEKIQRSKSAKKTHKPGSTGVSMRTSKRKA